MRIHAITLFGLLLAVPAIAEQARFSVSLRRFNAGSLAFAASENAESYQVQGQASPSGLARKLYPGSVKAAASGRVDKNRYAPRTYSENVTKRGKAKRAEFSYSGGVPRVTKTPPDRNRKKYHANASGQKGTIDPLTTVYAILRDRPADLACNLDVAPFDGRERTRVRMRNGKLKGDHLICPGVYSRVSGFSSKEMAEKVHWPFTVTYRIGDSGLHRVERVDVPTTLGTVVFRRR